MAIKQTALRLSEDDLLIIDALARHYGTVAGDAGTNRTQTIRTAIRELAKRLKLPLRAEKESAIS